MNSLKVITTRNVSHRHGTGQGADLYDCAWAAIQGTRQLHDNVPMGNDKQRHFIREWRNFRQLTQQQLADDIGIDRSYVSNIENGRRRYDQHFLEAAATVLKCSPADLIGRNPTDPDGLWSIWYDLEPSDRAQLSRIAVTFIGKGKAG